MLCTNFDTKHIFMDPLLLVKNVGLEEERFRSPNDERPNAQAESED